MTGIITFPSYHTTLAVLLGWVFIGIRRLSAVVVVLEIATIACTRVVGGHYYADIAAGAVVALVAMWGAILFERGTAGFSIIEAFRSNSEVRRD